MDTTTTTTTTYTATAVRAVERDGVDARLVLGVR